jgi:hypothetical protein
LFKNRISAATENKEEKGNRSSQKKDRSWREGRKSVRTLMHVHHFPDLPGREITIEDTSTFKHCTTATKKSPRIKMGWKTKKRESIVQK